MENILIIEDEQSIADTLIHCIEREGYAASWCTRGSTGLERLKVGGYALVVLDVGLPDINGFELCKAVRKFSSVPVIFLTARDDEIDKIVGLEIGGDDYVTKPFSPRELVTRIKAVLRRGRQNMEGDEPAATIHTSETQSRAAGALMVDLGKMTAVYHGKSLDLTRYEFKLLALLAQRPGSVYSREELMQKIWGSDSPSMDRTVDAHIKSLRAKCREINEAVDPILTRRGTGYALREDL